MATPQTFLLTGAGQRRLAAVAIAIRLVLERYGVKGAVIIARQKSAPIV
jgi:hypothetical protein